MITKTANRIANPARDGAMLPMVGVVILILFVACTFAVDIARIHLTRSELRTATDAAARAAVESLSRVQDTQTATNAALEVARRNIVAGNGLDLRPQDIVFGTTIQNPDGSFNFQQSSSVINAVRVVGERSDAAPDGPVDMLFGPFFGQDNFATNMASTATRLDRDIALVLDKSGSMSSKRSIRSVE